MWVVSNIIVVYAGTLQELVISQNIGGQLQVTYMMMMVTAAAIPGFQIHTDWPSYLRNKGVFFVKREKAGIPDLEEEDEDLLDHLTCGDVHPNVLGKDALYTIREDF